jgi:hypothetical protein
MRSSFCVTHFGGDRDGPNNPRHPDPERSRMGKNPPAPQSRYLPAYPGMALIWGTPHRVGFFMGNPSGIERMRPFMGSPAGTERMRPFAALRMTVADEAALSATKGRSWRSPVRILGQDAPPFSTSRNRVATMPASSSARLCGFTIRMPVSARVSETAMAGSPSSSAFTAS